MSISGNLPPYYPPNLTVLDQEDEKIQPQKKTDNPSIEKPEPKLNNGGLNYVW